MEMIASDFTSVCPSVRMWVWPYITLSLAPIPAVVSQNGNNKSCFLCLKSESLSS